MKLVYRLALSAVLAGGVSFAAVPAAPVPTVAPVPAADTAPDVVVRGLYESYFAILNATHDDPNMGIDWLTASKPYMTPELLARIAKMENSGEPGIDVDMLIAAQDWSSLKVDSVTTTASDATMTTVRVTFTDTIVGADAHTTNSDVKLAKLAAGWRIADIVTAAGTPDEYSITKALTDLGL